MSTGNRLLLIASRKTDRKNLQRVRRWDPGEGEDAADHALSLLKRRSSTREAFILVMILLLLECGDEFVVPS